MKPKMLDTYDPADAIESDEAIEISLADAFETGDTGHIAAALNIVARARGRRTQRRAG